MHSILILGESIRHKPLIFELTSLSLKSAIGVSCLSIICPASNGEQEINRLRYEQYRQGRAGTARVFAVKQDLYLWKSLASRRQFQKYDCYNNCVFCQHNF